MVALFFLNHWAVLLLAFSPLHTVAFRKVRHSPEVLTAARPEIDRLESTVEITHAPDFIDDTDESLPEVLAEVATEASEAESNPDFVDDADESLPEVLTEVAADASEAESNVAATSRPDIADIYRIGWRKWDLVKDGRTVRDNVESKKISAKPRGIPWSRIGTWNTTYSSRKTQSLVTWTLTNEDNYQKVKLQLALKFTYGGRVKFSSSYPDLKDKGRFLQDIRVVPISNCASGYFSNAQVADVKVRSVGPSTDPVAEVKITIKASAGKSGRSGQSYKGTWEITVKGKTGVSSVRQRS